MVAITAFIEDPAQLFMVFSEENLNSKPSTHFRLNDGKKGSMNTYFGGVNLLLISNRQNIALDMNSASFKDLLLFLSSNPKKKEVNVKNLLKIRLAVENLAKPSLLRSLDLQI